jgi:hypothetical protein
VHTPEFDGPFGVTTKRPAAASNDPPLPTPHPHFCILSSLIHHTFFGMSRVTYGGERHVGRVTQWEYRQTCFVTVGTEALENASPRRGGHV